MDNLLVKKEMLTNRCDSKQFKFASTEELTPMEGILGQERAYHALEFGLSVPQKGYNIYVAGQWGTGRNSFVNMLTKKQAIKEPAPDDLLYVNNFVDSHKPIAINIKKGQGKEFINKIGRAIKFLRKEIPENFANRDYQNAKQVIIRKHEEAAIILIKELNEIGKKYNFQFSKTEEGIVSIPLKDGKAMTEDLYSKLTQEEYDSIMNNSKNLSLESLEILNDLKIEEEKMSENIDGLDAQLGRSLVDFQFKGIVEKYKENPAITSYLKLISDDIVKNIGKFKELEEEEEKSTNPMSMLVAPPNPEVFFERYKINLLVDNSKLNSAPVIFESNPSYFNLVGNIEYKSEMGIVTTDYTMIKPGALHKANGGYLILLAKDILSNAHSWTSLKRALLDEKIAIEGRLTSSGAILSHSIKPQPVDLSVKVIIIGDEYTYYMLNSYDEEFQKIFKVMSDFDIEIDRTPENINKFARFIATKCHFDNLHHFDKEAVAKVIDYANRITDNKEKLTAHLRTISDLVTESNAWANYSKDNMVKVTHVEKAMEERYKRGNKYEKHTMDLFADESYLMDIEGEKVGEINGLAVVGSGENSFGKPSKITVSTYQGRRGIINIEREAKTSGNIHDKGVMIITGYLGKMFAQEKPLALTASIVFEQLYSGVDGDSASSTELYALLSDLADLPIKQYIAVTGSINQRGYIQPIGGVNEKIEGYYKVCKMKGLTGNHGVIIPKQNIQNLMLSDEVSKAIEEGKFRVWAIGNIDEGIEILTGIPAGKRNSRGNFPKGTVYYKVNKRLKDLAKPFGDLKTEKES